MFNPDLFQSRHSGADSSFGVQAVNDVGLFGLSSLLRRRLINSGLVDKKLIDYSRFSTFFDMEKNKQESINGVPGFVSFDFEKIDVLRQKAPTHFCGHPL